MLVTARERGRGDRHCLRHPCGTDEEGYAFCEPRARSCGSCGRSRLLRVAICQLRKIPLISFALVSVRVDIGHLLSALWEMKLIVLVRSHLLPLVSFVDSDTVPCGGPGQNYGNKGAVGSSVCRPLACCGWSSFVLIRNFKKCSSACSLRIGSTSFCFVAAHLAAHDNRCQLRNANYRRIMQELSLGQKVCLCVCLSLFCHFC